MEQELERYVAEFLPEIPLAESMDDAFRAFYVFAAARTNVVVPSR